MKHSVTLRCRRLTCIGLLSLLAAVLVGTSVPLYAQSVSGRWLQLQRFSGTVTVVAGRSKSARIGDRLSAVGHGLVTGSRSSANLSVDTGIGTIAVAQNTRITIDRLTTLADGGRVTILDVPRGQARLQVRRFTNPSSRLELHTPSGVAAVRGTEFGVSVSPEGRTVVATTEGSVEATAASQSVEVLPETVSLIYPGQPPTPAAPLDHELAIRWDANEWSNGYLYLSGNIDAANTITVMGEELPVNRRGRFETRLSLPTRSQRVTIEVSNAVGETRTYTRRPWLSRD